MFVLLATDTCSRLKAKECMLQAEENRSAYWSFLEQWSPPEVNSTSSSKCWTAIVDQASKRCLPAVAKVMKLHCSAQQGMPLIRNLRECTSLL